MLATKLIEGLHIDFSKLPSTLNSNSQQNDGSDFARLPSTQPVTLTMGDLQLERERPAHGISASQPVASRLSNFSSITPTSNSCRQDIKATLREDLMMSQFAPQPQVPISLTRCAQRFYDICSPKPLTRFYSHLPLRQLLPILSESLHRVGIAVPPHKKEVYDENWWHSVWIKIRTVDTRRSQLLGGYYSGEDVG
ncbi:hypothetical protein BDZ91DRAFT_344760 [Kalaharituber pfeilii]|nr:hypothetical protein BDZ91DRAFT_344760 [Kalaharituber pfeilii]